MSRIVEGIVYLLSLRSLTREKERDDRHISQSKVNGYFQVSLFTAKYISKRKYVSLNEAFQVDLRSLVKYLYFNTSMYFRERV